MSRRYWPAAIAVAAALACASGSVLAKGGHASRNPSSGSHHTSSGSHHTSGAGYRGSAGSADHTGSHGPRAAGASGRSGHTMDATHGGTRVAPGVARDSHGKIARSAKAKDEFKRTHPCPTTGRTSGACPGYVIDHVRALKHGGTDAASNMQWQTKEAAKAKDRVE